MSLGSELIFDVQGAEKERWATSSWLVSCRLVRLNPGMWWSSKKNVLCSVWEGEYVQCNSWTVVVGFN